MLNDDKIFGYFVRHFKSMLAKMQLKRRHSKASVLAETKKKGSDINFGLLPIIDWQSPRQSDTIIFCSLTTPNYQI